MSSEWPFPTDELTTPEIRARLAQIRPLIGNWRANEERAAATLAINVSTTPFEQRERLLAAVVCIAGVEHWDRPISAPGGDIVPASPRDAHRQLVDRERTYLSNVPVHTPLSRLCRVLVRLGVIVQIDAFLTSNSGDGYNFPTAPS